MEPFLCAGTGDIALNKTSHLCLHGAFILKERRTVNKDKECQAVAGWEDERLTGTL